MLRGSEIRFKPSTEYFGIDIDSIRGLNIVQLLQRLFDKSFDVRTTRFRASVEWLSKRRVEGIQRKYVLKRA